MTPSKRISLPLLIFSVGYLVGVFPFCYFRHDDWLILGNSVLVLPRQWSHLWRATLLYKNQEVVWFFRPFFKGIVYLFYQAFGLHYYAWLATLLIMALGLLWCGKQTLLRLNFGEEPAKRFLIFFVATVPFHLGSLAWMGEGIMNVPVGLLLILNFYFFVRALTTPTKESAWNTLSVLCFILALGFKESAIFQPLFLFLFMLTEASAKTRSLAERIRLWLPQVIPGISYLIVRLVKMPWNPSYAPVVTFSSISRPLAILLGSLFIPTALWIGLARPHPRDLWQALRSKGGMLLFFIPCLLPYIGHGFFSPGWLFLPGLYWAWVFAWLVPSTTYEKSPSFFTNFGWALFILSLIPIVNVLNNLGWWQWKIGQTEIVRLVEAAPDLPYRQWIILDCPNPQYPKSNLERVVGFEAGFYNIWLLKKHYAVDVRVETCDQKEKLKNLPETLLMEWRFPHLTQISPAP